VNDSIKELLSGIVIADLAEPQEAGGAAQALAGGLVTIAV
jgi:hypothetical protein